MQPRFQVFILLFPSHCLISIHLAI